MTWLDELLTLALTMPAAYITLFVFVSAWLEFVFPPYFGDSIMLFGFFMAGQGAVATNEVFFAAVFGSILGSIVAFLLGERFGPGLLEKLSFGRRRLEAGARSKQLFETYGESILIVNRFIPFFRNFMIYGAGAFRLRPIPCLLANAVSVVAFVGLLMAVGLLTAGSWDQIQSAFQHFYGWLGLGISLALMAWLLSQHLRQTPTELGEGLD